MPPDRPAPVRGGEDELPGDLEVQGENELAGGARRAFRTEALQTVTIQREEEQLGPALQGQHGRAGDGEGLEPLGGAPQLLVQDVEAGQAPAGDQRGEAPAEALDLW